MDRWVIVKPHWIVQWWRAMRQPYGFFHDGYGLCAMRPEPGRFGWRHAKLYTAHPILGKSIWGNAKEGE